MQNPNAVTPSIYNTSLNKSPVHLSYIFYTRPPFWGLQKGSIIAPDLVSAVGEKIIKFNHGFNSWWSVKVIGGHLCSISVHSNVAKLFHFFLRGQPRIDGWSFKAIDGCFCSITWQKII